MNKFFICTNIIQLVNFYLFSKDYKSEIYVFIINYESKNFKLKKQIKLFSNKLGFIFIDNINELLLKKNSYIDLISRNELNKDEIYFINNFKIKNWFIVEDGLGDYLLSFKNFNICKFFYLLVKTKELFMSNFRKVYHRLFTKNKRSFKFETKVKSKLICENNYYYSNFQSLMKINDSSFNKYKIIIIGSLYNYSKNDFSSIYDLMKMQSDKMNINENDILYIPHPRLDPLKLDMIKMNYKWNILENEYIAEQIISLNKDAIIWSALSTSIIFARFIYNNHCSIFMLDKLKYYENLSSYIKIKSISCYLVSIGSKIMRVN